LVRPRITIKYTTVCLIKFKEICVSRYAITSKLDKSSEENAFCKSAVMGSFNRRLHDNTQIMDGIEVPSSTKDCHVLMAGCQPKKHLKSEINAGCE